MIRSIRKEVGTYENSLILALIFTLITTTPVLGDGKRGLSGATIGHKTESQKDVPLASVRPEPRNETKRNETNQK